MSSAEKVILKPGKGCNGMHPLEHGCEEGTSRYFPDNCEDCPRFGCITGPSGAVCYDCDIECCYNPLCGGTVD